MSNLPPEHMTARHLNPDFVPRARYDQLVAENQQLRDIAEKAQALVATTSYYRQPLTSRPEFEALAFALVDWRAAGTPSEPKMGTERPPEHVFEEFRRLHGTPSEDTG